jgi:hypothetical protein
MAPVNPKRTPGAAIHVKALSITSLAECSRRYGVKKKTKLLTGTVLRVELRTTGGRRSTWIHGTFDLGGNTMKDACLHSSSVKPGPAPPDDEDAFPPGLDPAAGTRNEESSADRGTDSGLTVEGEDTESSVTLTMANNPRTPPTDVRLASNLPQNTGERTGGATTVVEERNGVKWRVLTSNEIERDVNGE